MMEPLIQYLQQLPRKKIVGGGGDRGKFILGKRNERSDRKTIWAGQAQKGVRINYLPRKV